MFLEISQNSQENTCARVSFLIKLQVEVCNFIKKETLEQVFPSEFCKISKNTVSYGTPLVDCFYVFDVAGFQNTCLSFYLNFKININKGVSCSIYMVKLLSNLIGCFNFKYVFGSLNLFCSLQSLTITIYSKNADESLDECRRVTRRV